MSKYQKVLEILRLAQEAVSSELAGDEEAQLHQLNITSGLQRMHDRLAGLTSNVVAEGTPSSGGQKAGAGKSRLLKGNKFQASVARGTVPGRLGQGAAAGKLKDISAKVDAYQKRVGELYDSIEDLSVKDVLSKYSEIEIRGAARKAHMDVTDAVPARLTEAVVGQIKSGIAEDRARVAMARQTDLEDQIKAEQADKEKKAPEPADNSSAAEKEEIAKKPAAAPNDNRDNTSAAKKEDQAKKVDEKKAGGSKK
jgi:hypothetical protein